MQIEIREAVTRQDRDAVFRFRYAIYVEEMGRVQLHADHVARRIEEPLDDTGNILVAFEGTEVVGTVRFNYAHLGGLGHYASLYQMERFAPFFPDRTCVTTKLMVSRPYRNSSLGFRLCKTGCAKAIAGGMYFDFMDCNAHLLPFFQRLGYRQVISEIIHPEFGLVYPMVCVLHDGEYLRAVGSSFANVSAAESADRASVKFFYERFGDAAEKWGSAQGVPIASKRRHLRKSVARAESKIFITAPALPTAPTVQGSHDLG